MIDKKILFQQWCNEHFLNHKSLHYASEVRNQLTEICDNLGIVANKESSQHNVDQVRVVEILSTSFDVTRAFSLLKGFNCFLSFRDSLHILAHY